MANQIFCLIDQAFENNSTGEGVFLAVLRQRGQRPLEVGGFLIDLGCTGVKDAFYTQIEPSELEAFKADAFPRGYREESAAWARKLIEGALDYAKSLGLKAHQDYKKAARVLGGVRASDCNADFHFGRDGKPFYFQGKHSDSTARRIVEHLTRRLGEGGFHFMVEVPTALAESLDDRIDYFLEEASDGRLKKAKEGIEMLEDAHPEAPLVHFARGVIHVYEEAHELALESFDRAIALDPELDEAWMNKAAAHRMLDETVPMIQAYQQVVELTPPEDDLHRRASQQLEHIAQVLHESHGLTLEGYIEAQVLFEQALDAYNHKDFEQTIQIINEHPNELPTNEKTLTLLGNCYRNLEEWALAREALEQALDIDPTHHTARLAMTVLDAAEQGMDLGTMMSDTLKKLQAEAS